ncbi:N-acetyltransferase [Aeromicrobium endophyticum]|uniref:N-acetyltransferase n=1 Tax=Aeromicrobium endophyticum TaxID=2292704 RepID=A0A371P050_9ACTN|nr:N-acetyltransferase [Aeromicrobium endophyticum]REK68980.1 N-acetyltransferase [Aeromicrobium endophyticum]
MAVDHPLARLIAAFADGDFLAADGGWQRVEPWRPQLEAVVAFTGRAVFAITPDIADEHLVALGADGFGGAHDPRLVTALAGPDAWIDSLDALLVGRGTGAPGVRPRLVARPDLSDHPRARLAAELRDDVEVLGRPGDPGSTVATLARGVGGLRELSFEVDPAHRGGSGAALVGDALSTVPDDELVVAAVAPGNAASLRAVLSAGFTPLGSLQLFRRDAQSRSGTE